MRSVKEKKKQYYAEKKETTKEAKEQEKKRPKQLSEEVDERSKEKRRIMDLANNYLECENCKKLWDPDSLLKHIGNNEKCKSFYGLRFEEMKMVRNRERNEQERDIRVKRLNDKKVRSLELLSRHVGNKGHRNTI